MAHFAKVENGIVTQVIVADQDFIDSGAVGHGWIQTSYNTHGNQHPEGRPLRGNYAGIGYTYDAGNDVFIAPKPFDNWILNIGSWLWEPPVPMPQDEYFYIWDQDAGVWNKGDLRPIPEPEPEPVVETPIIAVHTLPDEVVEIPAVEETPVVEETPATVEEVPAEVVETPAETVVEDNPVATEPVEVEPTTTSDQTKV